MALPSDGEADSDTRSVTTQSSRLPLSVRKWLILAWLAVCGHIWFASDDSNEIFDTRRIDHSFAEPARETRLVDARKHHKRDGRASIEKKFIEEEDGEEEAVRDDEVDAENGYEVDDDDEEQQENPIRHRKDDEKNEKDVDIKNGAEVYDDKDEEEQELEGGGDDVEIEALQPISFEKCCIPAAFKQSNNQTDVDCFGTCFTERACDDMVYPFNSAEEKKLFPSVTLTKEGRNKRRRECMSPEKLAPPVEWCQKPHHGTKKGASAHLVRGIPPAGCTVSSHSGGSGAFQHVIIFPSVKLAFCGIPKVGITMWEQFLRFYIGAKDYPSLPHYKLDRTPFQFDQLHPDAQRRIWDDEEWTWAAFIRNPAERLLSGYLDKVKSQSKLKWTDGNSTFEAFIDSLSKTSNFTTVFDANGGILRHKCNSNNSLVGLSWCSDPHWRPQVFSCGMSERIDRFKYIGDIDYAADQSRELLSHVGLWESHGKHFINGGVKVGRHSLCNLASHPYNHTAHVGFQQSDEVDTVYLHAKKSKEKMAKSYTPEMLRKVNEVLYPDDYKLWKLVHANGNRLSKGKDLMPKLSSKCKGKSLHP